VAEGRPYLEDVKTKVRAAAPQEREAKSGR
jgi:hypothetical protein